MTSSSGDSGRSRRPRYTTRIGTALTVSKAGRPKTRQIAPQKVAKAKAAPAKQKFTQRIGTALVSTKAAKVVKTPAKKKPLTQGIGTRSNGSFY